LTPDVVTDTEETVSQSLSVESATFATTLPNYVLPTPTYTTPPYLFSPSPLSSLSVSLSTSTSLSIPTSLSTSTSLSSSSGNASTSTRPFVYSVPTLGQPARTGLGASTYSALLNRPTPTPSPLPTAHAPVVVVTDSNGSSTTQPMPMQTAVLGGPETSVGRRRVELGVWTFAIGLGLSLCIL
jgi:hypothetical protein